MPDNRHRISNLLLELSEQLNSFILLRDTYYKQFEPEQNGNSDRNETDKHNTQEQYAAEKSRILNAVLCRYKAYAYFCGESISGEMVLNFKSKLLDLNNDFNTARLLNTLRNMALSYGLEFNAAESEYGKVMLDRQQQAHEGVFITPFTLSE